MNLAQRYPLWLVIWAVLGKGAGAALEHILTSFEFIYLIIEKILTARVLVAQMTKSV